MNVAYHLTRNYYPYLLPAIMSLLEHNPKVRKIYIFCEDDEFPYELPKQCKVINVSGQEYISHKSPNWNNWFSWICLTKVCDGKYLPRVNRLLQLDVDTIVCDDLSEMYNMDMGDNWLAMVDEKRGPYHPYGKYYFNAGVVLVNLKQMRADGADDKMIEFLNTTKVNYIEQDAYNLIGKGRIIELDQRYNECRATYNSDNPAVVHFVGYKQHWLPNVPRVEFYNKYKKYERL